MKTCIMVALAATFLATATPALAQHDHAPSTPAPGKSAAAAPAFTEGVVKRVDKAAGRVTIAHDAIVNLDMPRMTMAFRVKDPAWLAQMKEGDRIRFAAENPGGVLTVVAYQPGK